MTEEDSKFLAEEMCIAYNPGFSLTSEHGFFVVWEWAKNQEWWKTFIRNIWFRDESFFSVLDLIGPALIPELVKFLRERKEEK